VTTTSTAQAMVLAERSREALAELAQAAAGGETADLPVLARVTQAAPLMVALEAGSGTAIGPITRTDSATLAVNDQVCLLWLPESNAYICLGKVT
jgi:hypothetical protein